MFSSAVFPDRKFLELHALAQSLFAKGFHIYYFVCLCGQLGACPRAMWHIQRSEDNPRKSFRSVHLVGPGDQSQVVRFVGRSLFLGLLKTRIRPLAPTER